MSDKYPPAENETYRQKPGQLLRQAREKLGMEQKDIASQLNLQIDMIAAVEEDDTSRLPAPTYVRGYIRSYARIVHLDGNMLIGLYDHEAAAPPEIIPDIRQPSQISSHDRPVKAFTYLVTFVLALLLIAWLLQRNYVGINTATNSVDTPQNSSASTPETVPEYSTPSLELSPYPETETVPPAVAPAQEPALILDASGLINNIGLPDTAASLDSTATAITTADTGLTEETSFTADEVNMKIARESWVEIHDVNNNRLYLGLARAGEEINVSGTAPFDVLLGYSPGVQVSYNGKSFDPAPYSSHGVAKFTLGAEAEEEPEQNE